MSEPMLYYVLCQAWLMAAVICNGSVISSYLALGFAAYAAVRQIFAVRAARAADR